MKHKTFYPVALSCAFFALSCGAFLIGCNEDDEADSVMRYTLAEEMTTRSENTNQPSNRSYTRKGSVSISDTTIKATVTVPYIVKWSEASIPLFTNTQVIFESVCIDENELYANLPDSVKCSLDIQRTSFKALENYYEFKFKIYGAITKNGKTANILKDFSTTF